MTHANLFFLGLASGLAILTLTAYRRLSPRWLRWLLNVTGLLMLGRYLLVAFLMGDELSPAWFANGIGLTLPGVFAVDQLVRHPAMTPKKLLRWYAPFLIASVVSLVSPMWRWASPALLGVFVLAFLWICGQLWRKLPESRIRRALLGLCVAYLAVALTSLLLAFGHWHLRGLLWSEMFALLAVWYAFETSTTS